jgi:hypothetical protein
MTNTMFVSHASATATIPSSELLPRTSTASTYKAVYNNEDSAELSNAAQQYLAASQSDSQAQGIVAQLVRAAAAGDTGALSLLTVI